MHTLRVNVDGGNVHYRFLMQLFIACIQVLPEQWHFLSQYTLEFLLSQIEALDQASAEKAKKACGRFRQYNSDVGDVLEAILAVLSPKKAEAIAMRRVLRISDGVAANILHEVSAAGEFVATFLGGCSLRDPYKRLEEFTRGGSSPICLRNSDVASLYEAVRALIAEPKDGRPSKLNLSFVVNAPKASERRGSEHGVSRGLEFIWFYRGKR